MTEQTDKTTLDDHDDHDDHGEHEDHVVSLGLLAAVFGALLVLTAITVGAAQIDLGEFNLLIALVIAVVKATLVVLFFMHLWWDSRFNTMALLAALFFAALFIGLTIMDTAEYQEDVKDLSELLPVKEASEH